MSFPRITVDPQTSNSETRDGAARVRDTTITVAEIVEMMEDGLTEEDIIEELPELELEDVRQAIAYEAAELLRRAGT